MIKLGKDKWDLFGSVRSVFHHNTKSHSLELSHINLQLGILMKLILLEWLYICCFNPHSNRNFFDIVRCDFVFDQKLKPYVVEVSSRYVVNLLHVKNTCTDYADR